ncbi:MAG: PHB depolymerase family esterase [Pseudomonadota bacterium]
MTRFAAVLVVSLGLGAAPAQALEELTLRHDGAERRYLLERPVGNEPAPTIVIFHGGGGDAERMHRYTQFTLARQGWVEIYPDGRDNFWNDGRVSLAGPPLDTTDDVGFVRALLEEQIAAGLIDPTQIYVAGSSNGGAMAQRMLCEAPDLVAGAASVIMPFPIGLDCPGAAAKPVIFFLGTEDGLVPFDGGPITVGRRDRGAVRPTAETLDFYAQRNGCATGSETLLPDADPDDGTRVRHLTLADCAAPVEAFIVDGGGHTWPGARSGPLIRRLLGRTSRDISATAEIEAFFKEAAGE